MNKFIISILLLFINISNIYSQSKRIESELMKCTYKAISDEGTSLKQLILDYETLLINEGVVEDSSGESYRVLVQNFANKNIITPSKLFCVETQKIKKANTNKFYDCKKTILKDSLNYDLSKLKGTKQALFNNAKPHIKAKEMLKVLSDSDFDIDYYKLRAFYLFCAIDTQAGINEIDLQNLDAENALNIYLDSRNTLYVNEVKKTIEQLKIIVRNHVLENKSKYVIFFKTERDTKYKEVLSCEKNIKEVIKSLRNEYALKTYNNIYENLNEDQKTETYTRYPLNFLSVD
ncbi:hypothetical protein [uncultured Lacinutrix sp.]|uniref:hypothetical protein n=1 Tax=uncultured Lacinutrix sp. TaxID=574032 RepID=UPI002604C444|nr:hypothetical protein [uncultured Lacinutrix sp.]